MLFGGYEHWMVRFWTLHKLDAKLLDALIATATKEGSLTQKESSKEGKLDQFVIAFDFIWKSWYFEN